MHSATRLDDLKILECFLQNSLHAHLGRIVPFRVQCLYKNDTLWVLAQHPADVVIDIPDTFKVLERALQAEEPKIPLAVKLYLRSEGNQRPYGQQSFTVYPLVKKIIPGEAAPAMTGMTEDRIALESVGESIAHSGSGAAEREQHQPGDRQNGVSSSKPTRIQSEQIETAPARSKVGSTIEGNHAEIPQPEQRALPSGSPSERWEEDRIVKVDTDAFVSDIENSFGNYADERSVYPQSSDRRRKFLLPVLGGLGLLALGSGAGYVGTRPCVLQVCTELTNSGQLVQSSFAAVNSPGVTGKGVLVAQQQLHQSMDSLKSIPFWSSSYGAAQASIQATEPQIAHLDTTVTAMNKGFQAATVVRKTPITLATWQESKQMWVEAIANLRKVPTDSQVYPLVQQKLTSYQSNLADIERRIGAENKADEQLKSAVDGVKTATQSQAVAKNLPEWQSVKTTWDKVTSQLTSIPSTTIAYPQAQGLLKSYQTQIATAQEKVQEENKATQNYNNAVKLAQTAKLAQKNNRLTEAVAQWNQSVVAIQSIPQTSTVFDRAKPLVFEYTKSFQQAEEQLKTSQKIALANKDLQTTCTGTPQICTYSVTGKAIVVHLMPLYTQTVMQTAMAASTQGDGNARAGIVNHVSTLGDALQTIGDNAKLPLEIYGADGKQIQSYRPPQ